MSAGQDGSHFETTTLSGKKRQQLPSGSGAIRQQEWKYAAAISFVDVFLQNRR